MVDPKKRWQTQNDDEPIEHTELWIVDEPTATPRQTEKLLYLIAKTPPATRGMVIPVPTGSFIGRSEEADIYWADERMSRRHAQFLLTGTVFYVIPLEARHLVLKNNTAITEAAPLQENDELTMGGTVFVVKILD